jgi:hypothetical protein
MLPTRGTSRGSGATLATHFQYGTFGMATAYDEAFHLCQSTVDRCDLDAFGDKQMAPNTAQQDSNRRRTCIGVALLIFGSMSGAAYADESGISFWLPGLYGSLSATPTTPGWSVATIYYHTSVEAAGAAAA